MRKFGHNVSKQQKMQKKGVLFEIILKGLFFTTCSKGSF